MMHNGPANLEENMNSTNLVPIALAILGKKQRELEFTNS